MCDGFVHRCVHLGAKFGTQRLHYMHVCIRTCTSTPILYSCTGVVHRDARSSARSQPANRGQKCIPEGMPTPPE
jgi:hypothetical protein